MTLAGAFVYCAIQAVCCSFALLCFWIFTAPGRRARVESWADDSMWTQTQCTVLNSGISYHGDHDHFKSVSFSECPGSYFCADEDDVCACDGTVTYGATTHVYALAAEGGVSAESSDYVTCSHTSGPFDRDPAVGVTKMCFCMPRNVTHIVGGRRIHRRECRNKANSDFQGERRLSTDVEHGVDAPEELAAQDVFDQQGGEDVETLEIPGANSRRRAFFNNAYPQDVFEPWALVEVASADSFHEGTELRCAYTYGAPIASRYGQHFFDYPFEFISVGVSKGFPDDAGIPDNPEESDVFPYTIPCWARSSGASADEQCAVSLEPVHNLVDEETATEHGMWWYILPLIICCCFGPCAFWVAADGQARELNQETSAEEASGTVDRRVPLLAGDEAEDA